MELTTPGPLSEQLNLNDKHSTENSIIKEHLSFSYGDNLNGDKILKNEIGDPLGNEEISSQKGNYADNKEKEHSQISPDPVLNGHSPPIHTNENSSDTNGSLLDNVVSRNSSEGKNFQQEKSSEHSNQVSLENDCVSNNKEMCPIESNLLKISSNESEKEVSHPHQIELTDKNSNKDPLGK